VCYCTVSSQNVFLILRRLDNENDLNSIKKEDMSDSSQSVRTFGGYMGLQLSDNLSFYPDLIPLNTARNSLEYILTIMGYDTIYLPYFTCEVILEPIRKLGLFYHFYEVDKQLNPIIDYTPAQKTCFLYTNYFGLKSETVKMLSESIHNLIIDSAQAFYAAPLPGIDTFYSCRKFFGLPDGAYLYTASESRLNIRQDSSYGRFSHLIKAVDQDTESGYSDFLENDATLNNNDVRTMSTITRKLLAGIDYEQCAEIRRQNFAFLHAKLGPKNELKIDLGVDDVPMVYPLLVNQPDLSQRLIGKKVFVATYWPNVFEWTTPDSTEYYLSENIVPLPIDQRYTLEDMEYMLKIVESELTV
jgi:hypothetical protein